jgi:hypothetical protein
MINQGDTFPNEAAYDAALNAAGVAMCRQAQEYSDHAQPLEVGGYRWRGHQMSRLSGLRRPKRSARIILLYLADDSGAEVAVEVITFGGLEGMLHAVLPLNYFNSIVPDGHRSNGTGSTTIHLNDRPAGNLLFAFVQNGEEYTHSIAVAVLPCCDPAAALRLKMLYDFALQQRDPYRQQKGMPMRALMHILNACASDDDED